MSEGGQRPPSELSALLSGHYPPFVYRRRAAESYLPVFAFHTLDPVAFDAQLRHLEVGGFRTIPLDAALAWLRGETDIPERSVVLTIDDGRLTTWSVGYPLLEARGMVATAFVIPGYLEEGPTRPRLSPERIREAPAGVCPPERLDRRTNLRWSEVEALHASGVISIESHTMLHRRHVVSDRLVGFVAPATLELPRYLVPLPKGRRTGWSEDELEARLGMPLFESLPILAARDGRQVPDSLSRACVEAVQEAGGRPFFRRRGWRRRLRGVVRARWPAGGLEPVAAGWVEEEQRWELEASKRRLEERLPGKRVRHLCLPEGSASGRTAELVREYGYESCIGTFLPYRETNRPGASPYRIGRLKCDYIVSLPGNGRRGLARVLWAKSLRRARGERGF